MTRFRPFLNSDPPHLVDIWRAQAPQRGLAQPLTTELLDWLVLAKPYFDREGLIVAEDEGRPVGFVHASFGPDESNSRIDQSMGTISLLMVRPTNDRRGLGRELVARGEEFLRSRGAQHIYAGGIRPLNGFYLGLYGGSELPGVLASTPRAHDLFRGMNYVEIDRVAIIHRDISSFRMPIDRRLTMVRRNYRVEVEVNPPTESWWDAATNGCFERVRFNLVSRQGGAPVATATFWDMQTYSQAWGVRTAGLVDVAVIENDRRHGLATCLLAEAFQELSRDLVRAVEVQHMQSNSAARALYAKLGFEDVDQGIVYRRQTGPA